MAENQKHKQSQILRELIKQIVNEDNLGNIVQCLIRSAGEKGDGYLAEKLTAAVTTDLPRILYLYIKCAPNDNLFRSVMPVKVSYEREIFFYDHVLPKLLHFQTKYNVENPFASFVHCYKTTLQDENEMLIFEDIAKSGYFVSNRFKPMETNQISAVLTEYAKFHAISFAMKDQESEMFTKLTEEINRVNIHALFCEGFGPNSYNSLLEASTTMFDEEKDAAVLKRFRKYNETFVDIHFKNVTCPEEYSIVTHGDCWNNNVMFKENDLNSFDVKLLDFQLMRVVSPIYDISSFIFTCGSDEILRNMEFYLNNYYRTLSSHIAAMGSDPCKVFSFKTFQEQWKEHSNYGMGMGVGLLRLATKLKEEVRDIGEDLQNNEMEDFSKDCASNKLYFERLKPVVVYCVENNLI